MKILDRYIFVSYVKTFVAVFVILMFIFLLQSIWMYISELAGKDLDFAIILKFLAYVSPSLIPLVLPLTILVTSIMTFGSFSENYEFAAMKSSGISLQRAMRSLIIFIGFLSVVVFFFANDVIPWSQFKSINLRKNISKRKPAMAIVEGAFNEIGDVNIKVSKKSGDNGQYLEDVVIHQKDKKRRGNYTVIKAKNGELVGSEDSDVLSLMLFEGNYYDELHPSDYKERQRKPHVKSYFNQYNINVDLSEFNNVDMDDEDFSNSYKMLDISELRIALDSISEDVNQDKTNFTGNLLSRSGVRRLSENPEKPTEEKEKVLLKNNKTDSITKKLLPKSKSTPISGKITNRHKGIKKEDSTTYKVSNLEDFFDSYSEDRKQQILNIAIGSVRGTLSNIKGKKVILARKTKILNKTEIQLHEKYALAVACFILFFVGAPLGAIIRKGGLGLPMVVAILLFLTYHFIGIFVKNSAEDGTVSPFIASWVSTLIMFPLGIYLTYRATTDQGFVNTDVITEPVKKFFRKIGIGKKDTE